MTPSRIHVALSDATQQIDTQLRPARAAQVQKAQAEVVSSIEAERQEIQHTLTTLATALRERAQADRAQLQTILSAIPTITAIA